MSLRARLRISIVAFAAVVVVLLSLLYLYDFTRLVFDGAHNRAHLLASEVRDYATERVNEDISARKLHPANVDEFRRAAADAIKTDPHIADKLRVSRASYDAVLNIEIVGEGGVLVAADPTAVSSSLPTYDFEALSHRNAFLNLWDLFFRREDYAATVPVSIVTSAAASTQPVFSIHVILQSVLLSKTLEPAFYKLSAGFFGALAGAMFLAALLPNLFLSPLERVTKRIESISAGEAVEPEPAPRGGESREFAAVQSKLSVLGQQFRGARQDAMELRRNVEQLLQRLEEAVLLFDSAGHLMMAGQAVERLFGRRAQDITGQTVEQVFGSDGNSEIMDAIRLRRRWRDHMITLKSAANVRALVSIEPLENSSGANMGTLITLRDAESRVQLETQLAVSSRLAALSRLTSGVAHEIKNPLNAMALHLEVLRSRTEDAEPEIEVISREIKRLDHVVKTFLNFNRPLELNIDQVDLGAQAAEIATLVSIDAASKGIEVQTDLEGDAWISGDQDLIKQAILNIVVNAIEAMKDGGQLKLSTAVVEGESVVVISDTGPGIPAEVQDKIFNLYFSTKENGSGIGLAMTFRVIQMHSGTIDFVSERGKGTSFRMRFPALGRGDESPLSRAAGSGRRP